MMFVELKFESPMEIHCSQTPNLTFEIMICIHLERNITGPFFVF